MANSSKARSRLPSQVAWSGTAKRASISGLVRKSTNRLDCRFGGIASTRWITAECSGHSSAVYRKKERIAVRRRFRLREALARVFSKLSRNVPISGAFRSVSASLDGDFPNSFCANFSSRRKVSR
jgi:hypothetical protein